MPYTTEFDLVSFDARSAIMYVRVRTLDGATVIDTRESVPVRLPVDASGLVPEGAELTEIISSAVSRSFSTAALAETERLARITDAGGTVTNAATIWAITEEVEPESVVPILGYGALSLIGLPVVVDGSLGQTVWSLTPDMLEPEATVFVEWSWQYSEDRYTPFPSPPSDIVYYGPSQYNIVGSTLTITSPVTIDMSKSPAGFFNAFAVFEYGVGNTLTLDTPIPVAGDTFYIHLTNPNWPLRTETTLTPATFSYTYDESGSIDTITLLTSGTGYPSDLSNFVGEPVNVKIQYQDLTATQPSITILGVNSITANDGAFDVEFEIEEQATAPSLVGPYTVSGPQTALRIDRLERLLDGGGVPIPFNCEAFFQTVQASAPYIVGQKLEWSGVPISGPLTITVLDCSAESVSFSYTDVTPLENDYDLSTFFVTVNPNTPYASYNGNGYQHQPIASTPTSITLSYDVNPGTLNPLTTDTITPSWEPVEVRLTSSDYSILRYGVLILGPTVSSLLSNWPGYGYLKVWELLTLTTERELFQGQITSNNVLAGTPVELDLNPSRAQLLFYRRYDPSINLDPQPLSAIDFSYQDESSIYGRIGGLNVIGQFYDGRNNTDPAAGGNGGPFTWGGADDTPITATWTDGSRSISLTYQRTLASITASPPPYASNMNYWYSFIVLDPVEDFTVTGDWTSADFIPVVGVNPPEQDPRIIFEIDYDNPTVINLVTPPSTGVRSGADQHHLQIELYNDGSATYVDPSESIFVRIGGIT
jgi:hypothetical protein